MKADSPIVIVDDDEDDHSLVTDVCEELKISNPLLFFSSGEKLLNYLNETKTIPFIIISEVKLPGIDGFELRKKLLEDNDMKNKSTPFVFWSSKASEKQVHKAYDLASHGFFIKDHNFEELKSSFKRIIDYWYKSEQPDLQ